MFNRAPHGTLYSSMYVTLCPPPSHRFNSCLSSAFAASQLCLFPPLVILLPVKRAAVHLWGVCACLFVCLFVCIRALAFHFPAVAIVTSCQCLGTEVNNGHQEPKGNCLGRGDTSLSSVSFMFQLSFHQHICEGIGAVRGCGVCSFTTGRTRVAF